MGKKHKHPEHENLERWLVSYADFITLLFATFTALYALSQTDLAKFKEVSEAIREGFEEQSIMHGINNIMQGKSHPTRNPDPLSPERGAGPGVVGKFESLMYQPGEVKRTEQLVQELQQDLQKLKGSLQAAAKGTEEDPETALRPVDVAIQERGVCISFDSRLLFEAGGATLREPAKRFLNTVAQRLKDQPNVLHVEGHTDDLPISTAVYPSNWELSSARASSVIRYFVSAHGFNPARLVALGYGSTQPLTSNKTPEGRAKNRRVDIIVLNSKASQLASPRAQFAKEIPILIKAVSSENDGLLPGTRPPNQPVPIIIREPDGTEHPLIPRGAPTGAKPKPAAGGH